MLLNRGEQETVVVAHNSGAEDDRVEDAIFRLGYDIQVFVETGEEVLLWIKLQQIDTDSVVGAQITQIRVYGVLVCALLTL